MSTEGRETRRANLAEMGCQCLGEQWSEAQKQSSTEHSGSDYEMGRVLDYTDTQIAVANPFTVPPARLAGDNALDVFQKHREKELKERQKLYW